MTKDEAVKQLKHFKSFHNGSYGEPINMAIEALEQQPCEDVIDRAEAMTGIMMFTGNVKSDEEDVYIKVSDAVQLLRELSPVTPQPKTGHWEQYGNFWEDKFKCSECGNKQPKILCGERIVGYWSDYCPNCGADMRGENDE